VSVGRLPAEVSSFVGRTGEIAAASAALGTTRLLTLVGPGGVGKTRLALRVAEDVATSFPGGVWFVALGKLVPSAPVAPALLHALGHRDDAPDAVAALEAGLADRRLLLVLDNCEHVLDETVALIDRLLRAADGLTVLATSRHVLGADGERVTVVPPLPIPAAAELFRTRAIAAGADLTDAEDPDIDADIDRVCRHLDGVPLALELAAVRLRSIPLAELVRHLEDILPLLGQGGAVADHHDALAVTLDWSHRLCDESERRAWRLLSVFHGPFDIDAAQAVLAGSRTEVVGVLGRLLDKSVVQRRGGGPRYAMLETVRQYGRTMLREDPEGRRAILAHRGHYFRLGARGATDYVSERDLEWFTDVRENLADLRVALAEGVADAETRERAVEAIVELRPYWAHTGLTREGLELVRLALEFEPVGTVARAGLLCAGAQLAALLGLTAEAHTLAEKCAAAERTSPRIAAELVEHRGLLALLEGRAREAVDLALAAVEQLERNGPSGAGGGVTDALMVACTAALETGDERLPALSRRNLRLTRQAGSHLTLATASWLAGVLQWRSGDPAAEATLDGALELFRPFDQSTFVGMTLEAKACLVAARGSTRLAARLFGACAALWRGGPPFPRHISDRVSAASRAAVRSALGPAAFDEHCAAGATLSRSAAIATALAGEEPVERPTSEGDRSGAVLTAREREVAALVAEGFSNRAIAERLVIAPRTAEAHVEHIRTKLGFHSRTQIAAWIARSDRGAAVQETSGTS
jgi:predicted ATPase/DNA-binding CsgD family transcriptional regulator